MPGWRNLLVKTGMRIRWYLAEAVPLFIIGTLLLFVLDRAGWLVWIVAAGRPVVTGLLGLPEETAQVLVMGVPAARLWCGRGCSRWPHAGRLTGVQAVVALTVMTLFVPCVANFLMMIREQGLKAALGILVFVTTVAISTGAGLHYAFSLFGVRF